MTTYLSKAQENLIQREILKAIQKISLYTTQHHLHVHENLTIMKASIANKFASPPSFTYFQSDAKSRLYASFFQEIHTTTAFSISYKPAINKNLEIILQLNSTKQITAWKDVFTDVIFQDLNHCIEKTGHSLV